MRARASGPTTADPRPGEGLAWFAGVRAARPVECVTLPDDAARLARGFWVVVLDFVGVGHAWRFTEVARDGVGAIPCAHRLPVAPGWQGPSGAWRSSMSAVAYRAGVAAVQERIRAGDVYQVNLCRVMSADLPARAEREPSAAALGDLLAAANPAPFAGGVHVPHGGTLPPVWLVSASPERFLSVAGGRVRSGPIKGTAATADALTAKDAAENVMITDMVRNDLQRVCAPATVEVTELLAVQHHPGPVHLVSWWAPDGGGTLRFGTGAGITWDSDPDAEWAETELEAARLVALAGGPVGTSEAVAGAAVGDGGRR